MHKTVLAVLAVFVSASLLCAQESETKETRLLRFPTIHDDVIVFSYAGNLYRVSANGGEARRLTSHEGYEMFPRFSPDGKTIAFTGQYDGNTEVYVMPAEGGTPRRLTFTATLGRDDVSDRMGPNNIVMGWSHDGKRIVFRSRMTSFNDFLGQLYTVDVAGGLPEELPLPRGGFCSFSPDDKKLAYNRVFREFRTWKRYRGGMADDITIYDFETKKIENITNTPAQEIIPMWAGDKIYFLSDRDEPKRMNLYSYDTKTKETKKHTNLTEFDIKFPSLGNKAIVFEYGGWIYKFDLAAQKEEKVTIKILEDGTAGRGGMIDASKNITNFEISPDGKRALFGARGDIFTVPAKHGPTRNLTRTPGVHERNAKWSPDGKYIAFVSDATGEDEIYLIPQGGGGPMNVTSGSDNYKYGLEWSPDSKKILWTDRKQRLHYVEVETKTVKLVHHNPVFEIQTPVWSPDSQWIAWTNFENEGQNRIFLYSLATGKATPVTDSWYSSSSPAFSGDGKYLFFVSNRDFLPTYSQIEWNHSVQNMARVYAITLAKDAPSPFTPKSDEVTVTGDKKPEPKKPEEKKHEEKKPDEKKPDEKKPEEKKPEDKKTIKIDLDGITERVLRLPVQAGNYGNLQSVGNSLYFMGARAGSPPTLAYIDMSANPPKETTLGTIGGYEISADGKKMLYAVSGGGYAIVDLPKGPLSPTAEKVDTSGMQMQLDRHQEWRQIYNECWRQMRDFFYAPNMHGVDWPGIRKKYEPLVAHVNHRNDLTYIIGEMIGELNAGHAYVGGGERPEVKRIPMGLLGAKLKRDPKTGFWQIVKILPGSSWDPAQRSPLREPGVNVKEGDFIIAVNGQPSNQFQNIFEAFVGMSGKQVVLKVNGEAKEEGGRETTVIPISDEADLYYHEWVNRNLKHVEEATGGKVGYLHVPDMQVPGLVQFLRQFYPQLHKKALIIDMRGNGGGNVSPMIIERLRREIAMINIARNTTPSKNPGAMLWGPMVCLLNEFSASDGDLFPYQFKHYKMGKLIGKRSWGGVVGIRGTLPLLDGGTLNRPEFSRYDVAGKEWIIEGHGVDPDIVVDNDPAEEYAGKDAQLDRAIQELLEELKTKEKTIPPPPPPPVR